MGYLPPSCFKVFHKLPVRCDPDTASAANGPDERIGRRSRLGGGEPRAELRRPLPPPNCCGWWGQGAGNFAEEVVSRARPRSPWR